MNEFVEELGDMPPLLLALTALGIDGDEEGMHRLLEDAPADEVRRTLFLLIKGIGLLAPALPDIVPEAPSPEEFQRELRAELNRQESDG